MKALQGVRILDFSWFAAGPQATKVLGAHGAEVLRVESQAMMDSLRLAPPLAEGEPQINKGYWFANVNAQKASITLNMNRPEGQELARKLAAISDIVFNNFGAHVMEKWDMAYQDLVRVNPDIIVVEMPMYGKTGPRKNYDGFGNGVFALAGLCFLTTYPGVPPVGTPINYPDHSSNPYHAAVAMLAALHHRHQTGRGQYVDISQVESTASVLDTAVLEYTANGHIAQPQGNRSPYAAPHGIYGCRGENRWCAIAVTSQEEWHAFRRGIGNPEWAADSRFATLAGRLKHGEELDRLVEEWTSTRSPEEVMHTLQRAGVPAGTVQNSADLLADPQLQARGFYTRLEHPEIGAHTYEGPSVILSRTPGQITQRGPLLGEHNDHVFRDLLGLPEDLVNQYIVEGIIY